MAIGEATMVTERDPDPVPEHGPVEPGPTSELTAPGDPDAVADGPFGVTDRTSAVLGRTPGPFLPRQLARLDEALTLSSRETGLVFSVYVGALDEPTREHAERLHTRLPDPPNSALLAVSPGQRVVHVVTGQVSGRRLPDRSCALAVLSMEASFTVGDLVGGLVNGLRMLADQAGRGRARVESARG
ncbi:MAG: hypothetical protein V7637_6541 [Mycobacteriales bacterium]|jgi:hypothetical protein